MSGNSSIRRKLLFPILGAVALVLLVSAVLLVTYIRKLALENVSTETRAIVRAEAFEIRHFYVEKAKIALTLYNSPFFLDFFSRYRVPRAPIRRDPDYLRITESFRRILETDSTLESVFFAVDATGEYFDEEGRYEEAGYSAKRRSWWQQTLEMGRMFCTEPEYDIADSTITSTLDMPVTLPDGRFLGIGGIDILVTTVEDIVGRIRYKGEGRAFLAGGDGRMILFPDIPHDQSMSLTLSSVDRFVSNSSGFRELSARMASAPEGRGRVRWKGKAHTVIYAPVSSEEPYLNWTLGLLVPESLMLGPVRRITLLSMLGVALAMVLVFLSTGRIVARTVRPLDALAYRLDDMANRQGDLTQTLPVETSDVIGLTARNFNTFTGEIRRLLVRVIENTRDLVTRTAHLQQQSESISEGAKHMTRQAQLAAVTSDQMMKSVDEIARGVGRVVQASGRSSRAMTSGEAIVRRRVERMKTLNAAVTEIAREMERLASASQDVTKTADVIRDVTEQVTLLSMNASIEAVRAGEFGRAFAVVADEIKTLSQRTQESNAAIFTVVQDFAKQLQALHGQIRIIYDQISEEFTASEALNRDFDTALEAAGLAASAADEMKNQTEHQAAALRDINQNIQNISEASDQIARGILESFGEITAVNRRAQELSVSAEVFKVE